MLLLMLHLLSMAKLMIAELDTVVLVFGVVVDIDGEKVDSFANSV